MEFLIASLAMAGSFVAAVVAHIIAHDFCAETPKICHRLIRRAARTLPTTDGKLRQEEWEAHLDELTGVVAKLQHAFECIIAARRLRKIPAPTKPAFKTLRIEFREVGFVDLDYPTSLITVDATCRVIKGIIKARRVLRGPIFRYLSSRLFGPYVIAQLIAAALRHRKCGSFDAKRFSEVVKLTEKALYAKNSDFIVYRDGIELEAVSHLIAHLKQA